MSEPDIKPITQKEILQLSYQYQKEWRFEREKRLMIHALILFPNWHYIHQRLEWHSRPEFHKDPSKSKTQPRKSLALPRDSQYIPKQATMESICFVTGADSKEPYFSLCVQLIESIKATRWYNHIPIKVLDCGLTSEDKDYLIKRFNVDVKDPGWDVDPQLIHVGEMKHWSYNGWKGIIARPYIHKHFPGYEYYFWMDADSWIQNDNGLDIFISLCEKQGLAIVNELDLSWDYSNSEVRKSFIEPIPFHYFESMANKPLLCGGFYCISKKYNEKYATYCDAAILERKQYGFGFDMSMLNYCFYKDINAVILNEHFHYYSRMSRIGAYIDTKKNILTLDSVLVNIISLTWYLKQLPYKILFSNSLRKNNKYWTTKELLTTKQIAKECPEIAEEKAHRLSLNNKWQQGNYFYRVYLNPEDMYGPIEEIKL